MSKVYIVRCPDYSQVDMKLAEAGRNDGRCWSSLSGPVKRIALKPNLLLAGWTEKAATNPFIRIAATGKLFGKIAASIVLAESPAPVMHTIKKRWWKPYQGNCGMQDAAENWPG